MPPPATMAFHTDLRQVTCALAEALDLVGVDDLAHGKRVAIMAVEIGRRLGLPDDELDYLFDLGLLHDIGVSSTAMHRHLVESFDWAGAQGHADIGYERLAAFAPLAHFAMPVRYHHARWDEMAGAGLDCELVRRANLILLADRVDAFCAQLGAGEPLLAHADEIREAIREHSGTWFSPALVRAFLERAAAEDFWLMLEPAGVAAMLAHRASLAKPCWITLDEMRQLAHLFARIVDAKSPFTAQHSHGVARLSRLLAERLGLPPARCDLVEMAGLLHDVGKLRVPDEILDKPGPLTPAERAVVNAHSYETWRILRPIEGFAEVANWAAWHHEEPDGSGYPFHLKAGDLPLEARILRVADIFQALVQDRPYRRGLDPADAIGLLKGMAARGSVDPTVLEALVAEPKEPVQAARPGLRAVAA
ncbi:MAG TPA: HD domain-containing protein [Usitatibacteraceae bacterium]|nr:HD domain-containing protein [Usitatibacteraceae bacterium]